MSEKKSVATSQQEEKKLKQQEKTVIYLGPAIAGVAVPGTVYKNGLTPQMERTIKEIQSLKKLLVEVKNAGQVRKEIRDPQTAAGVCYQKVLEYAKRRGEK